MSCRRYFVYRISIILLFGALVLYLFLAVILEIDVGFFQSSLTNEILFCRNKTRGQFLRTEKYFNGENCDESVYVFERKGTEKIFTDRQLWKKCGINDSSVSSDCPSFNAPSIRTKCRLINATLISKQYVEQLDNGTFFVPNVVHYILFGSKQFSFLNYLSFKSSAKFIKPRYIFVHGDYDLSSDHGSWWTRTLHDVPNVFYVYWPQVKYIQGKKVLGLEHMADIVRLQIIQENGGIYLDTDVLVLKSFDPLRKTYPLTLGRASRVSVANGIIISAPHQPFLCLWLNGYRDYNPERRNSWSFFSVVTGNRLSKLFPHLVHIEERSLLHPSWAEDELPLLFSKHYDWSNNYAIHVWRRYGEVPNGPQEIEKLNTTLGDIMRLVYF